ncbi:MAG: PQQ-dependent sugar dehydrogenase [Acidimicrobiales bacterium]
MTIPRRLTALAIAASLLAAACGDDDSGPAQPVSPIPSLATTTTTDASADDDGTAPVTPPSVDDLASAAVELTLVHEAFQPIDLITRPGERSLYVAERAGLVLRLTLGDDGAPTGDTEEVVDIGADTEVIHERGLLGIAFDPDGEFLYASFTDDDGDTRVDQWRMDGDGADEATRRTVFSAEQPFANHNGGQIRFGPDGMLYLGLGDGGSSSDPLGAGQDPTTVLGAVLRIDPTASGDLPYEIPDDNPFVDGGGEPEIWMTGVRNPWRFDFDAVTGDLWVADVGQGAIEEVTVLFADGGRSPGRGANLGWAIFEGNEPFHGGPEPENYAPPLHTYGHGPGCSITGGVVSRGDALPALRGAYLYSDFCDPTIYAVLQRDGVEVDFRSLEVQVPGAQVAAFGTGPAGEVYVLSLAGGVFRIDPA